MKIQQFDDLGRGLIVSVLGIVAFSVTAIAGEYECMLVKARPLEKYILEKDAHQGALQVGEVVLEGINFGTNPTVYFGNDTRPAKVMSVSRSNNLDTITLRLPPGTRAGTYKLIIQNTTGPFLDDNGEVNPIFCFGSVTFRIVSRSTGS